MSSTRIWGQTSAEVLDYSIDWAAPLASDTIINSQWSISPVDGGDVDTITNDTSVTTIWVSGLAEDVTVTNRVVTSGGRTHERSLTLRLATTR